jgi:hypothetical protein
MPGAVWAGRSLAGQRLRQVRLFSLPDGTEQLELTYGGACWRHCILVKEGRSAAWAPRSAVVRAAPSGTLLAWYRIAEGRVGALALRVEGQDTEHTLAAARALRPLGRS